MPQEQNINNDSAPEGKSDFSLKLTKWLTIVAVVLLVVVIIGGIVMYFTL